MGLMGSKFSAIDYREQVINFSKNFLSHDDSAGLSNFLMQSEDFYNVFTTCLLEDMRKVKQDKVDNLIFLMSFVSTIPSLYLLGDQGPARHRLPSASDHRGVT